MKFEDLNDVGVSFLNVIGQGITVEFDCSGIVFAERGEEPPYDWQGFYTEDTAVENIRVWIDLADHYEPFKLSKESFLKHFGRDRYYWLLRKADERLQEAALAE